MRRSIIYPFNGDGDGGSNLENVNKHNNTPPPTPKTKKCGDSKMIFSFIPISLICLSAIVGVIILVLFITG